MALMPVNWLNYALQTVGLPVPEDENEDELLVPPMGPEEYAVEGDDSAMPPLGVMPRGGGDEYGLEIPTDISMGEASPRSGLWGMEEDAILGMEPGPPPVQISNEPQMRSGLWGMEDTVPVQDDMVFEDEEDGDPGRTGLLPGEVPVTGRPMTGNERFLSDASQYDTVSLDAIPLEMQSDFNAATGVERTTVDGLDGYMDLDYNPDSPSYRYGGAGGGSLAGGMDDFALEGDGPSYVSGNDEAWDDSPYYTGPRESAVIGRQVIRPRQKPEGPQAVGDEYVQQSIKAAQEGNLPLAEAYQGAARLAYQTIPKSASGDPINYAQTEDYRQQLANSLVEQAKAIGVTVEPQEALNYIATHSNGVWAVDEQAFRGLVQSRMPRGAKDDIEFLSKAANINAEIGYQDNVREFLKNSVNDRLSGAGATAANNPAIAQFDALLKSLNEPDEEVADSGEVMLADAIEGEIEFDGQRFGPVVVGDEVVIIRPDGTVFRDRLKSTDFSDGVMRLDPGDRLTAVNPQRR